MTESHEDVLGREYGRRIAPEGTEGVHRSQMFPGKHPGTCQVPFMLYPRNLSTGENAAIRTIWKSSNYFGRDFMPFEITSVPSKYLLAQVLACGLKAANATYSQHWEGMYFDWTLNEKVKKIINGFPVMPREERFVNNAFATVVLLNTGYGGHFMEMLKLRRRPIPPSMQSLEQIDMGTFEHNIRAAVGAVLGGEFGVNAVKHAFSKDLISGANRKAYDELFKMVMAPGMNQKGRIAAVIQIGVKRPSDRAEFDPFMMKLAAAKLIERKSERRNIDFSLSVPYPVMLRLTTAFRSELRKDGLENAVKTIVIDGNTASGQQTLAAIRDYINEGLQKCHGDIIRSFERNRDDGLVGDDFTVYSGFANMVVELGRKVLKPREDAHRMLFVYIDLVELEKTGIPVDIAEHVAGEAIQAVLNSVHLDGTTGIPGGDDLRFGAFCLTGSIHSAELHDSDEELNRGYGQGFWNIVAPDLPPTNKMLALIAVSAKREQDAMIAERQAMEQRKSVNDIFWYRTWNHTKGKKLDIEQWISGADVLHVVPIPGNDVVLVDRPVPEHMPSEHPVTEMFMRKFG